MSSFIDRMRILANDKDAIEKTFQNEYHEKMESRKNEMFKSLTFKYYNQIIYAIENASKHGNQYVYMNFDRDAFKANFHGLGTPAQFQRLWLRELCNPESKYLDLPNWQQTFPDNTWSRDTSGVSRNIVYSAQRSAFVNNTKRDSFNGVNFDVWNNRKFTTVFSWDIEIDKKTMNHYHTHHWQVDDGELSK